MVTRFLARVRPAARRGCRDLLDHRPDDTPARGGRWLTCRNCGEVYDLHKQETERSWQSAW